MKSINPVELKEWQASQRKFMLIDVREEWERNAYNIGGTHIPMNDVMEHKSEIPKEEPVVMYCEKGIRSAIIIQRLEGYGFQNLYNLSGGMKAWKES